MNKTKAFVNASVKIDQLPRYLLLYVGQLPQYPYFMVKKDNFFFFSLFLIAFPTTLQEY